LESAARVSVEVTLPTVMTPATRAGEELHASLFSLPAEVATVIPAFRAACTAASTAALAPPPRLRFSTAGRWALPVTQSTPAMTVDCAVFREHTPLT
jgi:hypothetical protein